MALFSVAVIIVSMLALCLWCMVSTCKGPGSPTQKHYEKGWE